MSAQLFRGDILFIDWNCLKGRPRSSYQVVDADDDGFTYYRVGVNRVMRTTYDGINLAIARGDVSALIHHRALAQA